MSALVFWVSAALVAYVYIGYPVVVTLAAGLRRAPRWPKSYLPKVTLIIAAHDEEREIAAKLDAALALDYPQDLLQIIVAADGSTDTTPDIVRSYAEQKVELVHRPERNGKMAAINRAAMWATGEILVFSDANNRFDADAIRRLVAPFSAKRVGTTVGSKTITSPSALGASEGAYWRYESHIRRMETRLGCTVGVNGEICAIRRDLLREAPEDTINDDQWMAHSVITQGYDVVYCPDAISREPISASAADEKERRSRMVAGQFQIFSRVHRTIPWRRPVVAWMLISHKLLRPLVPFGMMGAAVGALGAVALAPADAGLAGLGTPWGGLAVGGQAVFYGLAAVGPRFGRIGRLAYIPRFLVDSNIAAARGLWRHLSGRQSASWERVARSDT